MTNPSRSLSNGRQANWGSSERRLGASGDNDIGEIVANVTERFSNRYRSAGATVRIGSADAAKSKIDRDVRMSRTAEYLHRQRRLNSARTFFQKSNVLLFRFANAAQGRAEANPDPVLRFVVRIFDSGVIEREFCRRDRQLSVTIRP